MEKLITHFGYNDSEVRIFEGLYPVPNGMAYNSYLIKDEKIAVCDTVDECVTAQWLADLEVALDGAKPDYLIVHHVEPDHSYGMGAFLAKYPDTVVVGNAKTFPMLENFYGAVEHKKVVAGGEVLPLGKTSLQFTMAAMIHWPEVMVSYEAYTKSLFAADAFGKFGVIDDEGWACEARRYYYNIVGKYGVQVQKLLASLGGLEINTIYSLHGPVLTGELVKEAIDKYVIWSQWGVESSGVIIATAGAHGNTHNAGKELYDMLTAKGVKAKLFDLTEVDMSFVIEDAFKYDKLVLAAATYYSEIFPPMENFLRMLLSKGYGNRKVGIIENGAWMAQSGKKMLAMIEDAKAKNVEIVGPMVTIKCALNDDTRAQLAVLADELSK